MGNQRVKAPVKESGKSSFAPQRGKGAFAPRGFAVQRKAAAVPGGELGSGELLDACFEREARLEGAPGVGAEVERVLRGRDVGGDAPMQLRQRDDEGEVENRTGMPDRLKGGLEQLSGMDLSGVRVHYNSAKPAQVGALAFTQGRNIHLGQGEERHLPHEGWHAVQQMEGRVKPTLQAHGVGINDDVGLERDADVMGAKAFRTGSQSETGRAARNPAIQYHPVQRMVGFEMELYVPSIGPVRGSADFIDTPTKGGPRVAGKAVKEFLLGGVAYGTEIGGSGKKGSDGFGLTADHNDELSRRPIIESLKNLGKIANVDSPDETSNLEYVTPPIDELAEGSDKKFEEQTNKLKSHMTDTLVKAREPTLEELNDPAKSGFSTGVPRNTFKRWLRPRDYAVLKPLLIDFRNNSVADKSYLQATVGIIPSALTKLFKSAIEKTETGGILASKAEKKALEAVVEEVGNLVALPAFEEHKYIEELDVTSDEAFVGLLHLLFSYIVGDTLSQTSGFGGGSIKNAVPFLIKMNPWEMLAKAGTDDLRDNPPPEDLLEIIADFFSKSKYAKVDFWINTFADDNLEPRSRRKAERLISKGTYETFVKATLGSAKGLEVVGPALEGPDKLPKDVKYESYEQAGIPLEYRWIEAAPSVSELGNELMKIVRDVRELNTKELEPQAKKKVLEDVKK